MLTFEYGHEITCVHPIPGQTTQSMNEAEWPCQTLGQKSIKRALAVGKGLAHGGAYMKPRALILKHHPDPATLNTCVHGLTDESSVLRP